MNFHGSSEDIQGDLESFQQLIPRLFLNISWASGQGSESGEAEQVLDWRDLASKSWGFSGQGGWVVLDEGAGVMEILRLFPQLFSQLYRLH
jgi:hypothetical protein